MSEERAVARCFECGAEYVADPEERYLGDMLRAGWRLTIIKERDVFKQEGWLCPNEKGEERPASLAGHG